MSGGSSLLAKCGIIMIQAALQVKIQIEIGSIQIFIQFILIEERFIMLVLSNDSSAYTV